MSYLSNPHLFYLKYLDIIETGDIIVNSLHAIIDIYEFFIVIMKKNKNKAFKKI